MCRLTIGTGAFGRKMNYDELRAVNNIIVGNPEAVINKLMEIIQLPECRALRTAPSLERM